MTRGDGCTGSGTYIDLGERRNWSGKGDEGRCPRCWKWFRVNNDGTLRSHGFRRKRKGYQAPPSTPSTRTNTPSSPFQQGQAIKGDPAEKFSNNRRHFDSWSEWLEAAQAPSDMSESDRHSKTGNMTFTGTETWEDAIQLAQNGWHDMSPNAEEFSDQVSETVITDRMATTFTPEYAVAGAVVDIGRYLTGEPECMINAEPFTISRAGRAVRLAIPVGVNSSIRTETIIRKGAAVMALANLLARANHPLEIWVGSSAGATDGSKTRLTYMTKVQGADESMDAGRLMFAIAHPSQHRRLALAVRETENSRIRQQFSIGGGYGSTPRWLSESDFPEGAFVGTSLILPPIEDDPIDWNNDQSIIDWIESTLTSIIGEEQ